METPRPRSKSRVLKDHLLEQMRQQRIPFGGRLPSENALMQKFSLSRSTVRQVLSELTIQGLIERQQGRGTFRAGGTRSERRTNRSTLVGVWFNWPSGPLFGPIAEGIRDELRGAGYHAVFEAGGLEPGAEYRGIESLAAKGLDGFIVSPATNFEDEHDPLIRLIDDDVPLVLVDRQLPGYDTDLVCTNNELGAEEMTSHLVRLGHRRIGFVGIQGISTLEDRLRGYRRVMQQTGVAIESAWVRTDRAIAYDCGRQAVREMLSLPADRRPTAIFGATDILAETAAMAAREMGLTMPRDLSVAGFDDVTLNPNEMPWLTTYAQPKLRIGQQAARLLLKRLDEQPRGTTTILLEGRIVERTSTAPPRE